MQNKVIIDSILFAMITVIIIVLGSFLPFVGILAPLPLVILAVRKGSKSSIISSLFVALILAALVNPLTSLIFIFTIGFIGVAMGAAFEEEFSSKVIILVGTLSSFLSLIIILVLFTYSLDIDIIYEFKEVLQSSSGIYQELGLPEEYSIHADEIITQIINFLKVTYPSFFMCAAIVNSVINYYFSSLILNRLGYKYKLQFSFRKLRFSKFLAIIYILSIIFLENIIGENVFIVLTFLLFIEGLSVIYYLFSFKNNRTSGMLFIIVSITFLFIPIVNVFISLIILLIGFLDIWIDFRKLHKS
ncbi:hypothetical protein U472_00850 [Orenia metallireducens]|uniref:DUF2232 domain-containing protein n=1 Tax=Orenia metallireducens TaxID=1413210 RepID=A0A1C0ACV4_9FIRM|nr:DUF2232 domain-containing protein [Orenia metallireducens]OCL28467.1 hypothetical protein U472_00850 [Orenia metallireducens]